MHNFVYLLVFIGWIPFQSHAEIYKWIDDKGGVHFSDRPHVDAKVEKLELQINTYTAPVITEIEYGAYESRVVIYGTQWCSICTKAKAYFTSKKIPFVEFDVEKNEHGRREFKKLGGTGVPIILVHGRRLNGYSQEAFDSLYYR